MLGKLIYHRTKHQINYKSVHSIGIRKYAFSLAIQGLRTL